MVLPASGYLIPSLGLGRFQPKFLQIRFSLSSPFGIPIVHKLACFLLSNRSHMLVFFFFFCLSICCPHWVIAISLSSRSLILSSVLFILLLIAFSSVFVFANDFSKFSWLLLIVSSSFLQ